MHIIVNNVPELAPAIKFYSEALELNLNRIIKGDVAEMSGASALIYLLAKLHIDRHTYRPHKGIKKFIHNG